MAETERDALFQALDVLDALQIHDYLDRWAAALGIADLLGRVKQEAARPPDE